jgi:hypothetical protein
LSILDAAIAARAAVLSGLRDAAGINQKLDGMLQNPEPAYLSRGNYGAEDVWRRRLRDRGKTAVVVLSRADCRKIEYLTVDVERCAPIGRPAPAEQN